MAHPDDFVIIDVPLETLIKEFPNPPEDQELVRRQQETHPKSQTPNPNPQEQQDRKLERDLQDIMTLLIRINTLQQWENFYHTA